jgi:hypothetical protein
MVGMLKNLSTLPNFENLRLDHQVSVDFMNLRFGPTV